LYIPKIPRVKSVKMFPARAMKAKEWNRGIAPLILFATLDGVFVTPQILYARE